MYWRNPQSDAKVSEGGYPISDFKRMILGGAFTLICTVYFSALLLVFIALPALRLIAKFLGSPRF
jgi:hypothetical protein